MKLETEDKILATNFLKQQIEREELEKLYTLILKILELINIDIINPKFSKVNLEIEDDEDCIYKQIIKKKLNPSIEIEGVLATMYDGRTNLSIQVLEEIKKFFPDKLYKTVIPRNIRLSEAPSFGEPIIKYDRTSKGAYAYSELAPEVIKNN